MSDVEPDAVVEAGNEIKYQKRKIWKRPEIIRASFDDTETGVNFGPEILVLLSS